MASPLYNNAWLASRQPGPDYTVDVLKSPAEQAKIRAQSGSLDGLKALLDAKAFLAKPSVTTPTAADLANVDQMIAWDTSNRQEGNRIAAQRQIGQPSEHPVQDITAPLSALGRGISSAALPGFFLGPEVGGTMGVLGGAMQVPDYIRRRLSPMAGEPQASVGEGVGNAADILLSGYFAGKGGASAASAPRPAVPLTPGEPPLGVWNPAANAYERAGKATVHPNWQEATARPLNTPAHIREMALARRTTAPIRPELAEMMPPSEDAWSALANLARKGREAAPPLPSTQARALDILKGLEGPTARPMPASSLSAAERAGFPQVEADQILARSAKSVPSPTDVVGESLAAQSQPWTDLTSELTMAPSAEKASYWSERARALKAAMLKETDPAIKAAQKKTWDAYQVQARVARQKGNIPRPPR